MVSITPVKHQHASIIIMSKYYIRYIQRESHTDNSKCVSLPQTNVCAVSFTTSWELSSSVGVTGADEGVGVTSAVEAVCIQPLLRQRNIIHIFILAACFLHETFTQQKSSMQPVNPLESEMIFFIPGLKTKNKLKIKKKFLDAFLPFSYFSIVVLEILNIFPPIFAHFK